MASGDFDGDRHPEIAIVNVNSPLSLLKNAVLSGKAVSIRLRGTASNRNAIGARVEHVVGARKITQAVVGGGSYFSQSDFALQYGLGGASMVDAVTVSGPSGQVQRWTGL